MKKIFVSKVLAVMTLLLSANFVIASEITVTVPDVKGAAKSAASAAKEDVETSVDNVKTGAKNVKTKAEDSKRKTKKVFTGQTIDINNATKTELKSIPGIGEAYSTKIIAGRPYTDISDLKTRKVIPAAVYEKIKPAIVVQ